MLVNELFFCGIKRGRSLFGCVNERVANSCLQYCQFLCGTEVFCALIVIAYVFFVLISSPIKNKSVPLHSIRFLG